MPRRAPARKPQPPPPAGPCAFPGCARSILAAGLCRGHYAQQRRHPKAELQPLRGYSTGDALERVSLRVPSSVRAAILTDPEGARGALASWAASRTHRND